MNLVNISEAEREKIQERLAQIKEKNQQETLSKLVAKFPEDDQFEQIMLADKLWQSALVRLTSSSSFPATDLNSVDAMLTVGWQNQENVDQLLLALGANPEHDSQLSNAATPLDLSKNSLDATFKLGMPGVKEGVEELSQTLLNLMIGETKFTPDLLANTMNVFDNLARINPTEAVNRLKKFSPVLTYNPQPPEEK